MDTSGWDEEHVARMHLVTGQVIDDGTILHPCRILLARKRLAESGQERGARLGIEHEPHLRLAVAVMTLLGKRLIRMHLNTEVILCVNNFRKKRKAPLALFHPPSAQESLAP